jgi:hypothetical protein
VIFRRFRLIATRCTLNQSPPDTCAVFPPQKQRESEQNSERVPRSPSRFECVFRSFRRPTSVHLEKSGQANGTCGNLRRAPVRALLVGR